MAHLQEDPQPVVLLLREGRGGSGLSDSQLHCTSPLGCARLRPASARLSAFYICAVRVLGKKSWALTRRVKPGWSCLLVLKALHQNFSRAFAREQFYSNADFRPFWCCFWEYHPSRHIDREFASSKQMSSFWTTYQHSSPCRFLLRWSWCGGRRLNLGYISSS